MEVNGGRWLREQIRDGVVDLWRLDDVLYDSRTPYQDVLVARTALGVTLFCDQNPQSAEIGQWEFHEAESIPGMLLADRVDRVLVIGCGEGTVSQIAVRAGVPQVDHVDLDQECVRICAHHLPYGFGPEEVRDAERGVGRIRLHYGDGVQFVREASRAGVRYDLVVLDLPEEQEGSEADHNALYRRDFLAQCRDLLTPGGVVSTHVSRAHLSVPTAGSVRSIRRPWDRFGSVFGTRVYFRSDEQPWAAIMLGRADVVRDIQGRMLKRWGDLPLLPRTMDPRTLARATTDPWALRP